MSDDDLHAVPRPRASRRPAVWHGHCVEADAPVARHSHPDGAEPHSHAVGDPLYPAPLDLATAAREVVAAYDTYMTPVTGDEGGVWQSLKASIETLRRMTPPG